MAQTNALVGALKKALKAHEKTYADVAVALDLTEASVKRLFSERSFTLKRMDQICQLMGIELSDLVAMMSESQAQLMELTEAQEQEIASDPVLLLIAVCLLNRMTLDDILTQYDIELSECVQKLAKLDRLKVIDLLPNNRVKVRVAANFSWREDGPIQRFYKERVEREFFASRFAKDTERLICINAMCSDAGNARLQRKMERLVAEFNELADEETVVPLAQRHGTTMVLAVRKWEYGLFAKYRRD